MEGGATTGADHSAARVDTSATPNKLALVAWRTPKMRGRPMHVVGMVGWSCPDATQDGANGWYRATRWTGRYACGKCLTRL